MLSRAGKQWVLSDCKSLLGLISQMMSGLSAEYKALIRISGTEGSLLRSSDPAAGPQWPQSYGLGYAASRETCPWHPWEPRRSLDVVPGAGAASPCCLLSSEKTLPGGQGSRPQGLSSTTRQTEAPLMAAATSSPWACSQALGDKQAMHKCCGHPCPPCHQQGHGGSMETL